MQLRTPVNKFPDFVRLLVRRLKVLCPVMGKMKIAQALARAGLHLGTATVGRMLKESSPRDNAGASVESVSAADGGPRVVAARYPNHVWHVDLGAVPIVAGFAIPWLPFTLPQRWPFCWWVAAAIDHFSRRVMGLAVFDRQPTSIQVRQFLARAIRQVGGAPKYIICDKGGQFWCDGFKAWCKRRGITPRFGAVGKHGSIAVVERFIRTMKSECTRRPPLVPMRKESTGQPVAAMGAESQMPRSSPCAAPQTLVKGQPGIRVELAVTFHDYHLLRPERSRANVANSSGQRMASTACTSMYRYVRVPTRASTTASSN